jgi:hypothetical protein
LKGLHRNMLRRFDITTAKAWHRRRKGSVMVEFVFSLPLLGFVIAMIFFFGYAMMNQQHMKMAVRDAVWRDVRETGAPLAAELNSGFLNNKANASSITVTATNVWPASLETEYQNMQAKLSQAAALLSDSMIVDRFSKGMEYKISAEFPSSVGAWQRFTGAIPGQAARDGLEWRRGQAEWNESVQEQFLSRLDAVLGQIPAPGDELGKMMRQLYLSHW